MTKADLVERVYEVMGCTKDVAYDRVLLAFEVLKNSIVDEGRVKIAGFGNFTVRMKADRNGRNPITGEALTIKRRKVLTFKPSQVLKQKINKG